MPTFESSQLHVDVANTGIRAIVGGPTFETDISTTGNGTEQRNGESGIHARRVFRINSEGLEAATLTDLLSFYNDRRGSTDSFLFRDPFDYTATAMPLVSVSGGRQLVKTYTVGSYTYYRPIVLPESGTVTLTGGGSVDYATGIVTGGSGGTWSGSFNIQARFISDQLVRKAVAHSTDAVSFVLYETFDYDWPVVANTEPDATLSYTLSLNLQVGRAATPLWNTREYTTGHKEERTQYFSADRVLYDPAVILLKNSTDLNTLLSLFLIARGRRSAFTYAGVTSRFAKDSLDLARTGYGTYEAAMSLVEL